MTTTPKDDPATTPPADLVASIRSARRIAVLTGAGISAESGIPTFRDAGTGLWAAFDPMAMASRAGFQRDPALVWGWYEARRRAALRASPNAGHLALRDLAALPWLEDLAIVTQNVDDLHERAGSPNVIHLHGSLFAPRCLACGRPPHATGIPGAEPAAHEGLPAPEDRAEPPPRCTHCGGPMRPGVVWFGEDLPKVEWSRAVRAARDADLMLVVGTSGRVQPAASLPDIVEQHDGSVWTIDPAPGHATRRRGAWRATAAIGLPALVQACRATPPTGP